MGETEVKKDKVTDEWKLEVNNRYQKVVDTIFILATGSLVLPTIILRDFLGVPRDEALLKWLNSTIWCSWTLLAISIICCVIFYYASAKWIKQAYGEKLKWGEKFVELVLNASFWVMIFSFIFGIVLLLFFLLSSTAN